MRVIFAAILAGFVAGLVMSAAQLSLVTPQILKAETLEKADNSTAKPGNHHHATVGDHTDHHNATAWAPKDGFERVAFSVLANVLVGIGFAMVLGAATMLTGIELTLANGVTWGLMGFLVFMLAPSAGLSPELPGMPVADLLPRQIWWWATAAATAAALVISAKFGSISARIGAVILIALPHIVGAPQPGNHHSDVPAALAASFVANSIAVSAVFWIVLGLSLGYLLSRPSKMAQL